MKYSEAREMIRSGDLLAWTHKGCKSWYDLQIQLVRIFTKSEYSHVGIAWKVAGRLFVLEAVGTGVRIFPLSRAGDFYLISMRKELSAKAEAFALSKIGVEYSKWLAVKCFLGFRPKNLDHLQCALYANHVLKENRIDYENAITPNALVEAALQSGAQMVFVQNRSL